MEANQITATINSLSDMRKQELRQRLLEQAKVNRFLGRHIQYTMLGYALAVLDGRKPEPIRHRQIHRNGKVRIIRRING